MLSPNYYNHFYNIKCFPLFCKYNFFFYTHFLFFIGCVITPVLAVSTTDPSDSDDFINLLNAADAMDWMIEIVGRVVFLLF